MNSRARGSAGAGSGIGMSPPSVTLRLRQRVVIAFRLAAVRPVRSLDTFSNPQKNGMRLRACPTKTTDTATLRKARGAANDWPPPGHEDHQKPVRGSYAGHPNGR